MGRSDCSGGVADDRGWRAHAVGCSRCSGRPRCSTARRQYHWRFETKGSVVTWTAILLLSGGCYAAKLVGVVAGDRVGRFLEPVSSLLPPALFSALVVLMTVSDGAALVVDTRLAGVLAAVVAVLCRAPFAVVVAVAMVVTGGLRLVT
ncbi:MAG: hypothetical protein CL467_03655 [Acidimicrobiaceae bacterium]|nr:hypothetical protein [Acidimicrobiaceae bacterium]